MAKTKEQKGQILRDLSEKVKKSKSIIFTKFNALGVRENEDIRKELKNQKSEYYVAKKTLMNLALKDLEVEGLDINNFPGQLAAIFGYEDEVAPAKIVDKFKKSYEDGKIEFVGGILENKFITAEEVDNLAKLPSKMELYAKAVGSMKAPISGFVNALSGNLRNLVYVLKAVEEKKG